MKHVSYVTKKRALMFLDAVIAFGVVLTVLLLFTVMGRLDQNVTSTHDDLQSATKILEDDMECIGTFFSLPDRANLRINNLRDCTIINDATGEERDLPLNFTNQSTQSPMAPSQPNATSNDTAPAQSNNAGQGNQNNQGNSGNNGGNNGNDQDKPVIRQLIDELHRVTEPIPIVNMLL